MQQEEQRVQVPKLSPNGTNWVIYRDRLTWAMQTNTFDEHKQHSSPSTTYTAAGNLNGLTPEAHWTKEKSMIKQVLGSTLPDTAFNKIKATASVKDAWDTLKRIYEDRSKALVADLIRRFRNKRCEEDESIRSHFEFLANLREQLAAMGKAVTDDGAHQHVRHARRAGPRAAPQRRGDARRPGPVAQPPLPRRPEGRPPRGVR